MSALSRRRVLTALGCLVPLAGCSFGRPDGDEFGTPTATEPPRTPPVTDSPNGVPDPSPTPTAPPTRTGASTPSPTATPTESRTATPTATDTPTPVLNETRYQAVQAEEAFSTVVDKLDESLVLASPEWRDALPASELADPFVTFLDDTDFESHYVVGFGDWGEWMYEIKLEAVRRQSDAVRIEYSHLPGKPPNARMFKAVFVRLPRGDGVPQTVVVNRTDGADRTESG